MSFLLFVFMAFGILIIVTSQRRIAIPAHINNKSLPNEFFTYSRDFMRCYVNIFFKKGDRFLAVAACE